MSTRSLIARVSTIESNVDSLQSKADSENAVLTGTTSINGPVLLNGPVSFLGTISGINKSKVGLENVDNTSDTSKPISSLTQTALDAKAPLASPTFTGTVSGITKSMVGLENVDNTSDTSKPISSLTQTALDAKADKFTTYTKTEVIDVIAADISTAIAGKANASTTYTVDNVNNLLSGKQNSLTFLDPMKLDPPIAGFPLLIGTNIVPGLSVNPPLTLTRNTNNYLMIGLSNSIFNACL